MSNLVKDEISTEDKEKIFKKIQLSKEYTKEIMDKALALVKDLRQNTDSEKQRLTGKKNKLDSALKEIEDQRFVYKTISDEKYLSMSARFDNDIKIIDDELSKLTQDKSKKITELDEMLRLAENIGTAYKKARPGLKRNYLTIFFEKFEVKKGKIVKYHLTKGLKELIENGSVRVRTTGLPDPSINITPNFQGIIDKLSEIKYFGEMKQRWLEIQKLTAGEKLNVATV